MMSGLFAPALALIWAGVALGGSLVAAPAKFTAPSLDLPTALDVGRAQFFWVGVSEAVLCAGVIVALFAAPATLWKWMAAPIAIFAVQWLVVMPPLDARTLAVIGGAAAGETHLHIVFIVLEVLKVIALVTAAVIGLRTAIGAA